MALLDDFPSTMVEFIILRVDLNYKEKACLSIYSRLVILGLKMPPNPISIPLGFSTFFPTCAAAYFGG